MARAHYGTDMELIEMSHTISKPLSERMDLYTDKVPNVDRNKLVEMAVDEFLRKYGGC